MRVAPLDVCRDRVKPAHPCFVTSHGSSGTHLIMRFLGLAGVERLYDRFPHYEFPPYEGPIVDGDWVLCGSHWPRLVPRWVAHDRLSRARPGQYSWDHCPYSLTLSRLLSEHGVRLLFITRDPRDWALSAVRHRLQAWADITFRDPRIPRDRLPTEQELLAFYVFGSVPETRGFPMMPMDQRYRVFAGWRNDPSALHVRFEDLIGAAGGGDDGQSRETVARILDHLGAEPDGEVVDAICAKLFNPFNAGGNRRGAIGAWRDHAEFFEQDAVRGMIDRSLAYY